MNLIKELSDISLELRDLYLECQGNCSGCIWEGDCELQDNINAILDYSKRKVN